MKKVILLIAFVFAANVFASDNVIKIQKTSISEKLIDFKECVIKIKGTYGGEQIDVNVTVEADNCAVAAGKMLKAFAKK
jgi:hypothetical protein